MILEHFFEFIRFFAENKGESILSTFEKICEWIFFSECKMQKDNFLRNVFKTIICENCLSNNRDKLLILLIGV